MKRYLNDNHRDDSHQYPYTYQEIVNKFNRGTLWNRREYELSDIDVSEKLKSYFRSNADAVAEDSDDFLAIIDLDTRSKIIISDNYLYTE